MGNKRKLDFVVIEENAVLDFQFSLIDAMNELDMTKADLAKVLGVSRARISQLLVSDANPTLKLIARAMAAVSRSVQYCPVNPVSEDVFTEGEGEGTGRWGNLISAARAADDEWAVQQSARGPANGNETTRYARAA